MGNIAEMAGVGFEVEHAKSIVGSIETGVTATGSSQSDAYALAAGATVFSTVAASTGAVIPASLPEGSELRVYNAGSSNLSLYPPSGCTINDESANVAVIIPAGEGALVSRLSSTIFGCAGCSDLSDTELEYLDGVTAGTVTASKAVVVDSNKDVGDFRNLDCQNLDCGASGTAGSVDVFPSTASKGKLTISCTDQTGNTTVTVNANAMGQATTVNIADPGAAASYVVQSTAAVTLAEADVLDGATAGTVVASKAVVAGSGSAIAGFSSVGATDFDAGASGTAGSVDVFPSTASKGKLTISCTDQTGNTAVTVNANAMGQATTVNIADPGAAASYVVQSTAAVTLAEADVLDGATAGTVVASKAVVAGSGSAIAGFSSVGATDFDAGASGTAGSVDVFPSTASRGKLTISCSDQTGDTAVTVNANAMGQATTVNIADPGAAASYVVQSTAAVTLAEADVLDGATAGTVVASKAVVAGSGSAIAGFSSVGATDFDAGASGTAGSVDVFPATGSKGKLAITCTDQTGDTTVSLVAGAMAAARTITLRDPGAAASILTTTDGTAAATDATAVEITRACDVSARVVAVGGTTLALTEAAHSDKTIVLDHTAATSTVTLPASSGSGVRFKFVVSGVNTNNHIIQAANASDIIQGSVNILDLDVATQAAYGAAADSDTITLNGTTTGGQVGDTLIIEDAIANKWVVYGQLQCPTGSDPATPFSAAVS